MAEAEEDPKPMAEDEEPTAEDGTGEAEAKRRRVDDGEVSKEDEKEEAGEPAEEGGGDGWKWEEKQEGEEKQADGPGEEDKSSWNWEEKKEWSAQDENGGGSNWKWEEKQEADGKDEEAKEDAEGQAEEQKNEDGPQEEEVLEDQEQAEEGKMDVEKEENKEAKDSSWEKNDDNSWNAGEAKDNSWDQKDESSTWEKKDDNSWNAGEAESGEQSHDKEADESKAWPQSWKPEDKQWEEEAKAQDNSSWEAKDEKWESKDNQSWNAGEAENKEGDANMETDKQQESWNEGKDDWNKGWGQEEAKEEEVEPGWENSQKLDIGWEDAAWLLENDGQRVKKLEELAFADVKVNDQGSLRLRPRQGQPENLPDWWRERAARTLCAMHTGGDVEVWPLPPAGTLEGLAYTVVEIPAAVPKQFIKGKNGSRLLEQGEEFGVIAAFLVEGSKPEGAAESAEDVVLEVGAKVEGKYGSSFFEATVLAVEGDNVKVKWGFDDSEGDLAKGDVRPLPSEQKEEEPKFKKGMKVKAKYGSSFFEATVVEATQSGVKVCWTFDGSEQEVEEGDVQPPEAEDAKQEPKFKEGMKVQAKYGSSFYEATVVEATSSGAKVRWSFDGSEQEVEEADVQLPEGGGSKDGPLSPGEKVQGKYGADWYDAEVLEVNGSVVKVKWGFDGSEDDVVISKVKRPDAPAEDEWKQEGKQDDWKEEAAPEEPPNKVIIFGPERGRMEMELRLMNLMELKASGCLASRPKREDDCQGLGWSHALITLQGKSRGMLIGKGGSMRKRICKIAGSYMEYVGSYAQVVGTREERQWTLAILDMIQANDGFHVSAIPDSLEGIVTRFRVHKDLAGLIMSRRNQLLQIEDETDTLIYAQPAASSASRPSAGKSEQPARIELREGQMVEGKIKGVYREAQVLKVENWGDDSDEDDETDGRTVTLRYVHDGHEAVVPITVVREKLEGEAAEERQRQDVLANSATFAILGSPRSRCKVQLRLMHMLEASKPGHFSPESIRAEIGAGLGSVSFAKLSDQEAQQCQKKEVLPRLDTAAQAAGFCIVSQVGRSLCFVGEEEECKRCLGYAKPVLNPSITSTEVETMLMGSFSAVMIPQDKSGNLCAKAVAPLEAELKVLIYQDDGAQLSGVEDKVRFVVCGYDETVREAAVEKLKELQDVEWKGEEESWEEKKDDSWEQKKESTEDKWGGEQKSWDDKNSWDKSKDSGDSKSWGQSNDWQSNSWDDKAGKDDAWNSKDDNSWSDSKATSSWDQKKDWGKPSWDEGDDWKSGGGGGWQKEKKEWKEEKSDWKEEWKEEKNEWQEESNNTWENNSKKRGWQEEEWPQQSNKKGRDEEWPQPKWNAWQEEEEEEPPEKPSWGGGRSSRDSGRTNPIKRMREEDENSPPRGYAPRDEGRSRPVLEERDVRRRYPEDLERDESIPRSTWPSATSSGRSRQDVIRHEAPDPRTAPWRGAQATSHGATPLPRASTRSAPSRGAYVGSSYDEDIDEREEDPPRRTFLPGRSARAAESRRVPHRSSAPVQRSNPKEVLDQIGFPDLIEDWEQVQDMVFAGFPRLPAGWIRVWSRSQACEYYMRTDNHFSTFELDEVYELAPR